MDAFGTALTSTGENSILFISSLRVRLVHNTNIILPFGVGVEEVITNSEI